MLQIKKAERQQKKAKIALIGPSGSGKTMSALRIANGLKGEGRILLLDTERSSATLYGDVVDFDHANLPNFKYETFLEAIKQAAALKYSVLVIDSLSHAWESFLEAHETEAARTRNSFTAWAKITPQYNALINAIVAFPGHCLVTMRAKTDYVMEEKNGKQTPRKVGLAAVMRPGSEYEFDVVATLDLDHNLFIEKTRFAPLDGQNIKKPGEEFGAQIRDWLGTAAPATQVAISEKTEVLPTVNSTIDNNDLPPGMEAPLPGPKIRTHYDLSPVTDAEKLKQMRAYLHDKGAEQDDVEGVKWSSVAPLNAMKNYIVAIGPSQEVAA
jgi:hypothetical protein